MIHTVSKSYFRLCLLKPTTFPTTVYTVKWGPNRVKYGQKKPLFYFYNFADHQDNRPFDQCNFAVIFQSFSSSNTDALSGTLKMYAFCLILKRTQLSLYTEGHKRQTKNVHKATEKPCALL